MVKTEVVAEAKSLVLLVAPQMEKFEEKERAFWCCQMEVPVLVKEEVKDGCLMKVMERLKSLV